MTTATRIPFVDYLVLDPHPHLVAHQCSTCGARYFDRRNACAGCFGTSFTTATVATHGTVRAFTIVAFAAPGVEVPFVAAVVDCEGTSVRGTIINCPSDPETITLGMPVRLATTSLGIDANGVEAINYGFEPEPDPDATAAVTTVTTSTSTPDLGPTGDHPTRTTR